MVVDFGSVKMICGIFDMNIFQDNYERYQRRNDPSLPDKCELCGLRVKYPDTDTDSEIRMQRVAELQRLGLAEYISQVKEGGNVPQIYYSYFCALGHKKYWGPHKKTKKCPDWQLQLPDGSMNLSDYISIDQSKKTARLTKSLQIAAIMVGVISVAVALATLYMNLSSKPPV